MTATTQTPAETHQDPAPNYQLIVLFWNANLFLDLCELRTVPYKRTTDPGYPHFAIFQFNVDEEFITTLIHRLIKAGAPFDLCNFSLKDPV